MAEKRKDYPVNGRGERVSDIRFLLSCLDYLYKATGENLDPEDMEVIAAIKAEQT
jgi:hypothetical protein